MKFKVLDGTLECGICILNVTRVKIVLLFRGSDIEFCKNHGKSELYQFFSYLFMEKMIWLSHFSRNLLIIAMDFLEIAKYLPF